MAWDKGDVMTVLNKPVSRRTELDPRLGRKEAGPVTVTLYPDAIIGFRRLKRRSEVRLPLSAVYSMALKADVAMKRKEKKARKR